MKFITTNMDSNVQVLAILEGFQLVFLLFQEKQLTRVQFSLIHCNGVAMKSITTKMGLNLNYCSLLWSSYEVHNYYITVVLETQIPLPYTV